MSGNLTSIQHQAVSTATPQPIPTIWYAAAKATPVDDLPYEAWTRRAIGRFSFPNDRHAPDGARPYNSSPVWARGVDAAAPPHAGRYWYVNAGADFDKAAALAHTYASTRDEYGYHREGSQAILQGRDGTYYLASTYGWGDEVPVVPGEPGGPAGPYSIEDVADAGGVVRRYTPALKAVVGDSMWVDFRDRERELRRGDLS